MATQCISCSVAPQCTFREASPWPSSDSAVDPRLARAPVAGTVAAISVAPGDVVQTGQQLVCVEAMKMEMWLVARSGGRCRRSTSR